MGSSVWGTLAIMIGATALGGCAGPDSDKDEAEQNLAKWEKRGPPSYVYTEKTDCFCRLSGPTRIVVTDGLVTGAVDTVSGEATTGLTMTELLQNVVHDAGADNAEFEASYDSELGYLKQVSVDRRSDTADDEFATRVSCFGEGTGDDVCPIPK